MYSHLYANVLRQRVGRVPDVRTLRVVDVKVVGNIAQESFEDRRF
jgi:hypothetical protein